MTWLMIRIMMTGDDHDCAADDGGVDVDAAANNDVNEDDSHDGKGDEFDDYDDDADNDDDGGDDSEPWWR